MPSWYAISWSILSVPNSRVWIPDSEPTNRTLGRTVTENAGALEEMRRRLAVECTENFFKEMGALGYSRGEAADMAQAEREKNDE